MAASILLYTPNAYSRSEDKQMMKNLLRVPADGGEPEVVAEPTDVYFKAVFGGTPGTKTSVAIDLPAPWDDDGVAKDTLKELDAGRTGRTWNGETWSVYITALNEAVEHMCDAGYDVTVSLTVAKAFERGDGGARNGRVFLPERREDAEPVVDEETIDAARDADEGDVLTVHRADHEDTVGTVLEVKAFDEGVIVEFERMDYHEMRLTVYGDGIHLYTARGGSSDNGTHAIVERDVDFTIETAEDADAVTEEPEVGDRLVVEHNDRELEGVVVAIDTTYGSSDKVERASKATVYQFERVSDGHTMFVYDYGVVADLYNYRRQSSGRDPNGSRAIVATGVSVEVVRQDLGEFERTDEFEMEAVEVGDEVEFMLADGDVLRREVIETATESTHPSLLFSYFEEWPADEKHAERLTCFNGNDSMDYAEGDIAEPEFDHHSVIGVRHVAGEDARQPESDEENEDVCVDTEHQLVTDGGRVAAEDERRVAVGGGRDSAGIYTRNAYSRSEEKQNMSKTYTTTEDIRAAIHELNEGDIITVPQYANALEIEHLGELNGEKNAFVGVRFADPSKRTSANKVIILNKHSGTAYLSAGTTDKGAVRELTVEGADEAEDELEDEDVDFITRNSITAPDEPEDADEDEDEHLVAGDYVEVATVHESDGCGEREESEVLHSVRGKDLSIEFEAEPEGLIEMKEDVEETLSGTSEPADDEPESFEEEYRDAVDTAAAGIIEDVHADLGEDFQHVTLSDMPMVAAESIEDTLAFHEFVTESHNYLKVLSASEKDPDDYEWHLYADLDAPAGVAASNVLSAMAYVVFRADIEDALRGEC